METTNIVGLVLTAILFAPLFLSFIEDVLE